MNKVVGASTESSRDAMAIDERMTPKGDVAPVAETLKDCPCSVMIVGHMPFLSRLAGFLVAGDANHAVVQFQKAGVVGLTQVGDGWQVWCGVPPELI